jgi:outer membrane protein assembly factor BamA
MRGIPCILLLTLAGKLFAQAAFPLESLRVTGNRQIPAERIAKASGLAIGRQVQKADFDSARERLLATGAFTNVGYEYKPSADAKGFDGVIEIQEANDLFPYRFEDLPAPDAALREALRKVEPLFEERIPATAPMLARYTHAIEQALENSGNAGFQVAGKLNAEAPGELAVLFRPAVARPNIAEVRFVGNEAVPTALLLRTISEVAVGIPYTEAALRQRLDAGIRRVYEARGRIRVSFPTITTEPAAKVDGLVVTVTVKEGPAYSLGTVRFSGGPSGDTAQLEKVADLKKGDVINFDEVNVGLERVYKRLRGTGYLKVTANVNRDIHDDSHTVDLGVALEPGPRYVFGKLDLNGLDILTEPAIRKMWGAMEGKPFNPEFPDTFLARVREEGVLDNLGKTRSETHIDEASKTVGVTLYFSGAEPQPQNRRREQAPVPGPPPDIW